MEVKFPMGLPNLSFEGGIENGPLINLEVVGRLCREIPRRIVDPDELV